MASCHLALFTVDLFHVALYTINHLLNLAFHAEIPLSI